MHQVLNQKEFDVVLPVTPFDYPIWRGFKKDSDKIKMIWPENLEKRSQDLDSAYHDAGQWYWFDVEKLKLNNQLYTDNNGFIDLPAELVQDIDTPSDWKIAELKYRIIQELN